MIKIKNKMIPKKSLGQHFLRCGWVLSTLVKSAEVGPKDIILEIGPGTGVLTRELAKNAKRVIAIEKDERLAEELRQTLKNNKVNNVEIIPGDILKNLSSVIDTHKLQTTGYKLVSNIPYYLTSHLLRLLLEADTQPQSIVLTIQKEVAERIIAKPPRLNLIALSVQVFGRPALIKTVPRECFYPKPQVDSAVLAIHSISNEFFKRNQITAREFFKTVRQAFNTKRKTILNALGKSLPKNMRERVLSNAKINSQKRPGELTPEEWANLAREMGKNSHI